MSSITILSNESSVISQSDTILICSIAVKINTYLFHHVICIILFEDVLCIVLVELTL